MSSRRAAAEQGSGWPIRPLTTYIQARRQAKEVNQLLVRCLHCGTATASPQLLGDDPCSTAEQLLMIGPRPQSTLPLCYQVGNRNHGKLRVVGKRLELR